MRYGLPVSSADEPIALEAYSGDLIGDLSVKSDELNDLLVSSGEVTVFNGLPGYSISCTGKCSGFDSSPTLLSLLVSLGALGSDSTIALPSEYDILTLGILLLVGSDVFKGRRKLDGGLVIIRILL